MVSTALASLLDSHVLSIMNYTGSGWTNQGNCRDSKSESPTKRQMMSRSYKSRQERSFFVECAASGYGGDEKKIWRPVMLALISGRERRIQSLSEAVIFLILLIYLLILPGRPIKIVVFGIKRNK
jgi:hypothetical protein